MPTTPIIAVHLVFAESKVPVARRAPREQDWCAACIRRVWHLTPEEHDADIVRAAVHMTRVAYLCERIDLLEQDMLVDLGPGKRCHRCGMVLTEGEG